MTRKDLQFVRSTKCANAACVEVAYADGLVFVRDGKNVDLPYLTFAVADWHGFLDSLESRPQEARPGAGR